MVGKSFESPKPFDKEPEYELQSSEEKIKNTKIITITSGKGGVGKTSMSVNLGLALASQNKKVLLFDADLGLANINVVLGVVPKYNLYHVIKGHKKLKDIIIQTPEGLDIIAGASGYSSLANLSEKERNKIVVEVDQLKEYDYLLIDTGAGVSSNVIGFTLPADEILVITTPEPTSITDAYGIIKSIVLEASDKCIKLLVNRAATSLEGRKVAERVVNISNQFLNVKVENCGFIYDDEMVPKSIRKQKPFYSLYPKSKASSCLNVIAARLMGDKNGFDKKNVGIGAFFRKILKTN
ncbi:MAG: MinD/ParA family protein [Spirochaetia bacterium]|nr:MinD/ParA family protein [Spirochaetia bacterium]